MRHSGRIYQQAQLHQWDQSVLDHPVRLLNLLVLRRQLDQQDLLDQLRRWDPVRLLDLLRRLSH